MENIIKNFKDLLKQNNLRLTIMLAGSASYNSLYDEEERETEWIEVSPIIFNGVVVLTAQKVSVYELIKGEEVIKEERRTEEIINIDEALASEPYNYGIYINPIIGE